jgi:hypothetical protein
MILKMVMGGMWIENELPAISTKGIEVVEHCLPNAANWFFCPWRMEAVVARRTPRTYNGPDSPGIRAWKIVQVPQQHRTMQ